MTYVYQILSAVGIGILGLVATYAFSYVASRGWVLGRLAGIEWYYRYRATETGTRGGSAQATLERSLSDEESR
jgi:hypothetical protein